MKTLEAFRLFALSEEKQYHVYGGVCTKYPNPLASPFARLTAYSNACAPTNTIVSKPTPASLPVWGTLHQIINSH